MSEKLTACEECGGSLWEPEIDVQVCRVCEARYEDGVTVEVEDGRQAEPVSRSQVGAGYDTEDLSLFI